MRLTVPRGSLRFTMFIRSSRCRLVGLEGSNWGLARWHAHVEGGKMENQFPSCQKCGTGLLLPLSDYGREGASIMYKAWVCNNPDCGFNLRIDNGEISVGREITESHK